MSDKYPSGDPKLVKQHKEIQRKGDQELEQGASDPGHSAPSAFRERENPMRKRTWVPYSSKRDRFTAARPD